MICTDDVQQITAHQPILGIGVEIGIALAVGRSAGDCPLAIEIEVDGHQAGVAGGQPAQPRPAGPDRLTAEQIQPDGPHADPIQPFDRIGQQPIRNYRSIALEIVLVDADDAHGGGGPGGQGPELHRQVVGEQVELFTELALAQQQQQTKGGEVWTQLPHNPLTSHPLPQNPP